jgi:rod shape-determining protein MreC
MRRVSYKPYISLICVLLLLLSLPKTATEKMRSGFTVIASSARSLPSVFKKSGSKIPTLFSSQNAPAAILQELDLLQLENLNLKDQIQQLTTCLQNETEIQKKLGQLESFKNFQNISKLRKEALIDQVKLLSQSINGRVIFRDPSFWSSSLWIDIGQKNNRIIGQEIIAKNSPVVVGSTLVGVIEYVGERRSRVRLITDAKLNPSVRVVRGYEQNQALAESIDALQSQLRLRSDLISSVEAISILEKLKLESNLETASFYLAKGELYGSSEPLWRCRGQLLHGIGFNYDYADDEGPARHLATGELLNTLGQKKGIALIKAGDLLVTSGMDGIFPGGLKIGFVTHVYPLREGGISYKIEAKSLLFQLPDLSLVTVMPPLPA